MRGLAANLALPPPTLFGRKFLWDDTASILRRLVSRCSDDELMVSVPLDTTLCKVLVFAATVMAAAVAAAPEAAAEAIAAS
jgi:hypothetical protein